MKKSKPPQSKKQTSKSQPKPPPWPHEPLIQKVLRTWRGKVVGVAAAFGTLQGCLLTFDYFRSLYADTIPEIHVAGQDTGPFSLPFIVKNNSHFISMHDIYWKCKILSLNNNKNIELGDLEFVRPGNSIAPMHQAIFVCGVNLSTNLTNT